MPIFEYRCEDCGRRFEVFVTASRRASCPQCNSENLKKQVSTLGRIGSGGWGGSGGRGGG